jgi:hypothetical protein
MMMGIINSFNRGREKAAKCTMLGGKDGGIRPDGSWKRRRTTKEVEEEGRTRGRNVTKSGWREEEELSNMSC